MQNAARQRLRAEVFIGSDKSQRGDPTDEIKADEREIFAGKIEQTLKVRRNRVSHFAEIIGFAQIKADEIRNHKSEPDERGIRKANEIAQKGLFLSVN